MNIEYLLGWVAILVLFLVTQNTDDDDDPEGGMMVPSTQST